MTQFFGELIAPNSRISSEMISKSRSSALCRITLVIYVSILFIEKSHCQIISPEMRRLTVATNQFGIDALRALDRVEPPDKVLVFCPVCVSSSLMMIMMGSSKYQVVSSLRHALYVWSMKPHEINKGFKDIFDHIGINQNLQDKNSPLQVIGTKTTNQRSVSDDLQITSHIDDLTSSIDSTSRRMSLPNLIKMKETLDRSLVSPIPRPWWHTIGRQTISGRSEYQPTARTSNQTHLANKKRDLADMSQMNALSNIYVQRGLMINHNYNLLLRRYYRTIIHPVDFKRNAEETRQHINSLIAANTEGKIRDLVKKGSFESSISVPKIIMINTFHFRGTLDIELKSSVKDSKNKERFTRSLNRTDAQDNSSAQKTRRPVFIETGPSLLKYAKFPDLDCNVIEIPFNNRLVTLVIVMPNHNNTTETLISRLNAQVLSDMINSLVVRKLSIEIPVIKFDRGPVNMRGLVQELGLNNLFFGDQPYSSETGLNRWMRPSEIIHETSIDIGTINPNWVKTEDRLKVGAHDSRSSDNDHLRLDKPFFYFVMDSLNSLILTMGRIRQ